MLKPIKNKKSKIKQKRRRIALVMIITLLLLSMYMVFRVKNYAKNYIRNDFKIKEEFNKDFKTYSFTLEKEELKWHFVIEENYKRKKKLIEEIEYIEDADTKCVIPKSDSLSFYPQCLENNKLIDFHLISDELKAKMDEKYFKSTTKETQDYEKITLKNLDENTYYIWNYKGFYKINSKSKEKINLFEKDIYNVSNIVIVKDYLLIPDYNASYYFNKFYMINMKDGKVNEWEFKDSIYFDGYYLGSHNNSLFYIDKKMKIEWELLPKKKKMRKVGTENKEGKIWQNSDWEKISINKIINDSLKFSKEQPIHYEIKEGLIIHYQNGLEKRISKKNVKEIVATMKNKVYYLVEDSLYYYTEEEGEVEVMSYFEWNFNYKNMIFIKENN